MRRHAESKAHRFLKAKAIKQLEEGGYLVYEEYCVIIGKHRFRVDVAGFNGNKSIAIECGRTPYSKIELLKTLFTQVKKLRYTGLLNPKRDAKQEVELKRRVWASTLHKSHQTQVPKRIIELLGLERGSAIVWVQDGEKIFVSSPRLKT